VPGRAGEIAPKQLDKASAVVDNQERRRRDCGPLETSTPLLLAAWFNRHAATHRRNQLVADSEAAAGARGSHREQRARGAAF